MPKILFLTAYPIEDASCRYRVHQFIPYLERADYQCTVSPFATPGLFRALHQRGPLWRKVFDSSFCSARRLLRLADVGEFDFVVIHREAFPFFAPLLESWVIRRHPRVIFSFDDAIYAGHDDTSALKYRWLYRLKHGHGYDKVIRRSAHVIAGNRILADYARRLNPNVSVVPTVVDTDTYRFRPADSDADPLTIGWMGSPSTSAHLSLIEPALHQLAEVHADKVEFRFVGDPEYRPKLPRSRSLPFHMDRELDDLHSFDIGLMPLLDTEWTRGKCAFKAIQYMASGVPVVASPVGITPDLIQHRGNGLLARSAEEWFSAIDELVRNPELRQHLARSARKTVERSYSLAVWGPKLVDLFDQLRPGNRILETEITAA